MEHQVNFQLLQIRIEELQQKRNQMLLRLAQSRRDEKPALEQSLREVRAELLACYAMRFPDPRQQKAE